VENRLEFCNPINLNTAAVDLIVAIGNYRWPPGGLVFERIGLRAPAALILYQLMKLIARWRGRYAGEGAPLDEDRARTQPSRPHSSSHRAQASSAVTPNEKEEPSSSIV